MSEDIENSEIKKSEIKESEIKNSQVKDSQIKESHVEDSKITNSHIEGEEVIKNKKIGGSFQKENIKKYISQTSNFLKKKRVQIILVVVLILALIILGSWIRLQNLPLLKDVTTDKYIPLALDPFYFLRMAETTVSQGSLPVIDIMRYPAAQLGFTPGITDNAIVWIYKIGNIFSNISIQFADVIYPVIFFILGFIVFFFLSYTLTKSKIVALISSAFLAIIPSYLYRTMAGFADHEAIGMFVFFSVLLCYTITLKFLDKANSENKNFLFKIIFFGILLGFLSALTAVSWGGIVKFVFLIIPISFGLFWIFKFKKPKRKDSRLFYFIFFYILWIFTSILFGLLFNFSFTKMINIVFLSSSSIFNGIIFLFVIIDFLIIKLKWASEFIENKKLKKYRILLSIVFAVIIGLLFFSIMGKNILNLISQTFGRFLHPFGSTRTGLTVSENQQPYLKNWINQTGEGFFYIFLAGLYLFGIKIATNIKKKKKQIFFGLSWVILISGILFSRISSSSILNGTNLISKIFYFGSILLFLIYFMKIYFDEDFKLKPELMIIFAWTIVMLIAARGAIRFFFLITPFACFSAGFFIVNLVKYFKENKGEVLKVILGLILILTFIGIIMSVNTFLTSSITTAKYTPPSADTQWQYAMQWVRENTANDSIFVHWWDYGYWVQYLGKRPTVTDGGHGVSFWDHLVGRYVLTSQKPEASLSFMKTHNVSYLLMDPTDLGKYGAYSKIGSGPEGDDRYSSIPVILPDPKQTQETSKETTRVYPTGLIIDEDIIYNDDNEEIFLPAEKAVLIGIILKNNDNFIEQPKAVYLYNNHQYYIPLRYLFFKGKLHDFEKGLDSVIKVIPSIKGTQQMEIDHFGAVIYLSPKVSKSLFAQLYLLNDAFNNYPTIRLAHSENLLINEIIKLKDPNFEEIFYCPPGLSYGGQICDGFEGPIKIWRVGYPSNIITNEEFLRTSGEYAEFDNLTFTK